MFSWNRSSLTTRRHRSRFTTREVRRFFRMRRYAETLLAEDPGIAHPDKITHLLIRIIGRDNSPTSITWPRSRSMGTCSPGLTNPKTPRALIAQKILRYEACPDCVPGGLWATVDTLSSLRYGDAELLTDDDKIWTGINALNRGGPGPRSASPSTCQRCLRAASRSSSPSTTTS